MKKIELFEETIDGYLVSSEIKKLWQIELDIYKEIKRICDKYKLSYFGCGGTMLGIVRHNGAFIPWDDDIDICMPYDDFIKFRQVANKELDSKYFYQTYESEKGFSPLYSRVRDRNTFIETEHEKHYPFWNKGIFVDIFPTSNMPDNKILEMFHKILINLSYSLYIGSDILYKKEKITFKKCIKAILLIPYLILRLFMPREKIISLIDKAVNCFNNKETKNVRVYLDIFIFGFNTNKSIFPSNVYKNLLNKEFYDTSIYIPAEYDQLLTSQYGNWREFKIGDSVHKAINLEANKKIFKCNKTIKFNIKTNNVITESQ